MLKYVLQRDPFTGEDYVEVPFKGRRLVEHPVYNKGTAFSDEERETFDLLGLFPERVSNLDLQAKRSYGHFKDKSTDLEKYIYLLALQDRMETLFFRLMQDHLEEMLPIVYTPTVGQACLRFSHIYRRPRGIYVTPTNIHQVEKVLANAPFSNVLLVVVTDGERILGLGDQGAGGMGIPIGKSNLYVAAGGIHPAYCLPVMLDVGTNNETALENPLYIGVKQPRLTGDAYFEFVERFVQGVRRVFPRALLQWEDFGKHNAFDLLNNYRNRICSFNDDIQGTGAVATSALLSAVRYKGEKLSRQKFIIFGQGQAGTGIANQILRGLMEEGLTEKEARNLIFGIDKDGLLLEGMTVSREQAPWLKSRDLVADWKAADKARITLMETIRNTGATVLIGVTGQAGAFSEEIIAAVKENTDIPIILPLSNPTSKSECTPETVFKASGGKCIVAAGSPFKPVAVGGRTKIVSQCNNLFIFPGMGLGTLVSGTTKITDEMFMAACRAISGMLTDEDLERGQVLPAITDVRKVSVQVALAVAKVARDSGLGMREDDDRLLTMIKNAMWTPKYLPYRYVKPELHY
jgi:malate dehydrogenase (oxaloacetate-decarboxylating)